MSSNSNYVGDGNTWTHIAAAYDSSSGSMKIYINGVLDATSSTSSLSSNTARLLIGALLSSQFFDGLLDEIRLWSIERTADEIRADMCEKITGTESNLVGYWRFDVQEGLNIPDLTSNNNYASMYNMESYVYNWSGAAIGDESAYDYTASGGYTQTLSHPDGDALTAASTSGTVTGIQVYRVDSPPLRPGTINSSSTYTDIDPFRYWGVKIFGTNTPTYSVVYNYNGHPGIIDENALNLVYRNNLFDNTWEDLFAVLDPNANTLTKTGQTGTEFTLVSSNDPLPVELSIFNAVKLQSGVKLTWRTETEVGNYGFNVERRVFLSTLNEQKYGDWVTLGFIEGQGNSNLPKDYSFLDNNLPVGKYNYRLKQIDTDGNHEYSKIIEIDLGLPTKFELMQNYPNPFNPMTTISFSVPEAGDVKLTVFNLLGEEVTSLINGYKEAGIHSINFDATDLNSGFYLYRIVIDTPDKAGKYVQSKKMMLIK